MMDNEIGKSALLFPPGPLRPGERLTVIVELPAELVQKVVAYAERHGESTSWVMEQAMRRALREQKL